MKFTIHIIDSFPVSELSTDRTEMMEIWPFCVSIFIILHLPVFCQVISCYFDESKIISNAVDNVNNMCYNVFTK